MDHRQHVSVTARSGSSPKRLFQLLMDGSTWPSWSMFDAFQLERAGQTTPLGVGAIRVFSTRYSCAREEVIELVADAKLRYRLLSGLPLIAYEATVEITGIEGGALIRWSADFGPQRFGTGFLWRLFMTYVLGRTARDLARAKGDPP